MHLQRGLAEWARGGAGRPAGQSKKPCLRPQRSGSRTGEREGPFRRARGRFVLPSQIGQQPVAFAPVERRPRQQPASILRRCLLAFEREGAYAYRRTAARQNGVAIGSGWPDLNRRPPAPKAGALTKLRHSPRWAQRSGRIAERGQDKASSSRSSTFSSDSFSEKLSSDTSTLRALLNRLFSPADSPLFWSRRARLRTTSATW